MSTAATAAIMPAMLKATLKWALILASLLALGPAMAALMMQVRDVDGGSAATLLVNGDVRSALVAAAALTFSVLVVGVLAAKLFSFMTATMCAGFIVAWAASGEGTLESIVRRAQGGQDLATLAVEGLLVTLAAGAAMVLFAKSSSAQEAGKAPRGWQNLLVQGDTTRDQPLPIMLAGIGSGVLVGAAAVWLLALSGARNQSLASAIFAGIAAGAVNQAVSSGRSFRLTPVVPILSLALLAFLAPLLVKLVEGPRLLAHIYDGSVLNLGRPVSLDWAAGALIGVPLGMSWASSSGAKQATK